MEIWKQVKGFEGLYEVSNLGNVRSLMVISGNTPLDITAVETPLYKFRK